MLVDSHCHIDLLDLERLHADVESVLREACALGVGHMLCVCINLQDFPRVLALAREHDEVSASVGVHPNERGGPEPEPDELVRLADDARVVAVGETGLDYYRSEGDLEWQRERFRIHIAVAKEIGKPLIIHSRDAKEDTLRVMREENAGAAGGVMHCFTGDRDMAQRAMDMGFYISFSGIVTFKNARELQEIAARMPLDRMLVETDSPYLAPVPYRGKANQPAYVRYVAEQIAQLRGEPFEHIAESTTENFFSLFSHATRHTAVA